MTRIDAKFAALKAEGKKAFVAYIMAGDPDYQTSLGVVKGLPAAGVDVIELGLPFTDPMADGPTIQLAGQRALEAGQTLAKTLDLARAFREQDDTTPIVLMGYYNPIYSHGVERFLADAKDAGITERDRKDRRRKVFLVAILMHAHPRMRRIPVDQTAVGIHRPT